MRWLKKIFKRWSPTKEEEAIIAAERMAALVGRPSVGVQVIKDVQAKLTQMPGVMFGNCMPLRHSFGEGVYVREIFNPATSLIVTKVHKYAHPFFLLKGSMSIRTQDGEVFKIKAPHYGITPAGTQRIIYVHEDAIFVTVHPNPDNTRDIEKLEERLVANDFDELQLTTEQFKELKEA